MSQNIDLRQLITTHTLAKAIISRHRTSDEIFDDSELDLLEKFCADPTRKHDLLAERGWEDLPEETPGTKAQNAGSLAGYIVARHGTEQPVLNSDEIMMLKQWFEKGRVENEGRVIA